ncbi:MAG: M48 family metallopeptidase [Planctomycetes bacterium]|nr:M48 family metallopeptidase [Planctomycetota bacterium]
MAQNILFVLEVIFTVIALLLFLFTGASRRLAGFAGGFSGNTAILIFIYTVILCAGAVLIYFPFHLYGGYLLRRKFELSTQSFKSWFLDQLKGFVIALVFALIFFEGLYFVIGYAGDSWWIWAWAFIVLLSVAVSYLFPVLILPLFYKLEALDKTSLAEKLANLAALHGIRLIGIYRMNMSVRTKEGNAAVIGLGSTKKIILGDTIMQNFADDEIETIIAHELAHHKHSDMWRMLAWNCLTSFVVLWVVGAMLDWSVQRLELKGIGDISTLPLLLLFLFLFSVVSMPLNNVFSRWRERLADQSALEWTNKPDAFIRAMSKLAEQNLADPNPNPVIHFLLHSHPTIKERIAMAESWIVERGT